MAIPRSAFPLIDGHSRPSRARRAAPLAVFLMCLVAGARAAPGSDAVPPDILEFSRSLPALFDELGNTVAREEMVQQVYRRGRPADRRTLVSDYQVAHLDSDPSALWEFRFVRTIDGRRLRDFDRRISDFFLLRNASAREERIRLTHLAYDQSLPSCYWHNMTLTLDAFREGLLSDYDWRATSGGAKFRQVRGPGIAEDFFDPRSRRHFPSGEIVLAGSPRRLARLTLEFPYQGDLVLASLRFSPAPPPAAASLPREYEVVRFRRQTGEVQSRTTFRYSDFRRFSVETRESAGDSAGK